MKPLSVERQSLHHSPPMNQENELRAKAKELLASKQVAIVIGYGSTETDDVGAVFITDPDRTDLLVWNEHCTTNLTAYLKRKEFKTLHDDADEKAARGITSKTEIKRELGSRQ